MQISELEGLLDLGLPDKVGKDVIREIRSWSQIPIIAVSARDRETKKFVHLILLPMITSISQLASLNYWPA